MQSLTKPRRHFNPPLPSRVHRENQPPLPSTLAALPRAALVRGRAGGLGEHAGRCRAGQSAPGLPWPTLHRRTTGLGGFPAPGQGDPKSHLGAPCYSKALLRGPDPCQGIRAFLFLARLFNQPHFERMPRHPRSLTICRRRTHNWVRSVCHTSRVRAVGLYAHRQGHGFSFQRTWLSR